MTSIGEYAFYECRSLSSVELPESLTCMGDDVFEGGDGLKTAIVACSWKTNPLGWILSETVKFSHLGNISYTEDEVQDKISVQCDACNDTEKAVITAPVSRVYSGMPIEATVENTMFGLTPIVTYSGNNLVDGKP